MSSKNAAKLSIFCAAIAVVMWLWESDSALDALFTFVTAGEVPGTDVILTTDQTYVVVGALLLVVLVLLFRRNIGRSIRHSRIFWRGGRAAVKAYKQAVAEAGGQILRAGSIVTSVPALAVKYTTLGDGHTGKKTGAKAQAAHARKQRHHASEEERPAVVITVPAMPSRLSVWWEQARPVIIAAFGRALAWCLAGVGMAEVGVRRAAAVIRTYAIAAWRYTEPRIRAFDKKIEQTLKGNKRSAAALRGTTAAYQTALARIALLRTRSSDRLRRAPEE